MSQARQFGLALVACVAGAGLVVLALRQAWAHAVFTAPHPLPAQDISVSGQQLVPLASALALAALACLAAVIATRSWARRVAGVVLAALGAGAMVAAVVPIHASAVLAAARAQAASGAPGGSTTSGTTSGGTAHVLIIAGAAGHAAMTGTPWRAAAVCGGVVIVLTGLATAWRGPRWPVMSARFDRPKGGQEGLGGRAVSPRSGDSGGSSPRASSATIWESLSRDVDPTLDGEADRQDLAGDRDRTPG
ncbi:MAG: Trp biosynthesis-associated membrane protein [Streptosporangiaceae bacterium]